MARLFSTQFIRTLLALAVALGLVLPMAATVQADTFEWTDSQGGVHFTDNLDNVPAKYKNKVRKLDVKPMILENEQPAQHEQKPNTTEAQKLFGGHDETWWRSSYKDLREEMKSIQENLPECTAACPLHIDVRAFVDHVADDRRPRPVAQAHRHRGTDRMPPQRAVGSGEARWCSETRCREPETAGLPHEHPGDPGEIDGRLIDGHARIMTKGCIKVSGEARR